MSVGEAPTGERAVIDVAGLDHLIRLLRERGWRVVGPTIRDEAIVLGDVSSVGDLPRGLTAEQDGGTYRLRPRGDGALFGFATGPSSPKELFFPPRQLLWQASVSSDGFEVSEPELEPAPVALLGARSCDLHAIDVQDRVFMRGEYVDPAYAGRRSGAFIVAVNCACAGGTCFCVSMGTGPRATQGFDLALTELLDGDRHDFLVEAGTGRGLEVLAELPASPAQPADLEAAAEVSATTAASMGRTMQAGGVRELLASNREHPRWDDVAERCLACGNCTMVCPTCFCHTIDDATDLSAEHAERWQSWDSCFTLDFTYLHGGSVRTSTRGRYRHWLTHKLSTWFDQFGTSGCVGCGRCITWCPVGIDLTEEVAAIRASPGAKAPPTGGTEAREVPVELGRPPVGGQHR